MTSVNIAPPAEFKESDLSSTATALTWDKAFDISSPGNGLYTLSFKRPALIPCSRSLSTTYFVVPAVELTQTIASSASSNLYSSNNPYFLPVHFRNL